MESHQWEKQKEILRDKIQGVIFGAALGDAFGLATEFMNKATAVQLYGDGPIKFGTAKGHEFYRDSHRCRWHENDFTDDTDQMLLILQCLLSTNGRLIPQHFAFRLNEWTEIGFPELSNKACCGVGFTVGSVISHSEFVTNPHNAAYDIWESNGCNLAANGAVMRTSVLGIPLFFDELQVVRNAIDCAKVTHFDPRCIFSAVVVSVIISRMLRMELGISERNCIEDSYRESLLKLVESKTASDKSNEEASGLVPKVLETKDQSGKLFQWMESTVGLFRKKSDSKQPYSLPNHKPTDPLRSQTPAKCSNDPKRFSVELCGENITLMALVDEVLSDYKFLTSSKHETTQWNVDIERFCHPLHLHEMQLDELKSMGYTLKCLGSALFCFSRSKSSEMDDGDFFMQVITQLTLEAGDADTNAAVAGALLGSRLGFKGLPSQWVNGLRHRKFLTKICEELLELVIKQLPESNH